MSAPLGDGRFERRALERELDTLRARLSLHGEEARWMARAIGSVVELLDATPGATLQQRWSAIEQDRWACWEVGEQRLAPQRQWTWGPAALVLSRAVRPGWELLSRARLSQWLAWLPVDDPLARELAWLRDRVGRIEWESAEGRRRGHLLGLRIMLHRGYTSAREITDGDLRAVPDRLYRGVDALDAALCEAGVLRRSPQRGSQRRLRTGRLTPAELVAGSQVPDRFRDVHQRYLEAYQQRISDVYATTRHKHNSLEKLWVYLDAEHPEVASAAQVRRAHLLAFVAWAIARAREVQRTSPRLPVGEDRATAHQWLINVRCFLPTSARGRSRTARRSSSSRHRRSRLSDTTSSASASRRPGAASRSAKSPQSSTSSERCPRSARWRPGAGRTPKPSWALRRRTRRRSPRRPTRSGTGRCWSCCCSPDCASRKTCELTTLDILKRRHRDARTYYLLHVKPSKFDRARVIPIGDGLGRVIGQIIRHVKAFYGTSEVPACDGWDSREKRAGPHAPYLLQGAGHPSQIAYGKIRSRFARLSRAAGARRSDGSELVLRPHDCRRVFASEHLNNNTPIHVIQALLGPASPDTVMVYAKLYPTTLVDEYRKTVRATYLDAPRRPAPAGSRASSKAYSTATTDSCGL